jgi:iron complex outermembrane recepter protein
LKRILYLLILFFYLFGINSQVVRASPDKPLNPSFEELELMDFEALMSITIKSVSKKEEKLSDATAAIFVISQEDIRRSGVSTIAELFRMVPGIQVAQIDANKWAITSRGSNSRFANKLLVLVDGRSVYTSIFSGVYWDEQDLILEDIERIEVIRGPGGTLWGANAVNGVINIITKHSKDTLGGLTSAIIGSKDQGIGTFRYGGKLAKNKTLRVYGKYSNRDTFAGKPGEPEADSWHNFRGGFRTDWESSEIDSFKFQGEFYKGESNERAKDNVVSGSSTASFNRAVKIDGINLLSRWKHKATASSEMTTQFYFDHTSRRNATYNRSLIDTVDLDFQHRFQWIKNHEIIWGAGQRLIFDSFEDSVAIQFSPDKRMSYITSAFIQDEIQIIPDLFKVTLGSKIELNNYTGLVIQPNARALWTPWENHSFWAAVSRAVRTPARAEDSIRINTRFSGATLVALIASDRIGNEEVLSFEAGYRSQVRKNLFFDLAVFHSLYNNLQTRERTTAFFESTPAPGHNVVPFTQNNKGSGNSYGVEIFGKWNVQKNWELSSSFTYFKLDLDQVTNATFVFENSEGNDPEFQWNIRSRITLPHDLEFDTALYFVDALENINVDSYTRLDLRLGWKPSKSCEISISGLNLLEPEHDEFGAESVQFTSGTRVQRSVSAKLTVKF